MTLRTLDELAALCGGAVEGDGSCEIAGPAGLDDAGPGQISFLAQQGYAEKLASTKASAVVVTRDLEVDRDDLHLVRCDDPEIAFTEIVLAYAPQIPPLAEGIDPTAVVDPTAELAEGVRVGPQATIGAGARIGAGVTVHAGVRVGPLCVVGEGSCLHPNVVLYPSTVLGARCVVHAGSVLGSDGLGFRNEGGRWIKTPQVGNVVLEDDVEVGANVAIDCARFGSTVVGEGTKLDNLVHLAHNVRTGQNCLILAQVGIAGSSTLGSHVILAGQVGVAGHLNIGDGARVAAQSGLAKDVPAGMEMFGSPAGPSREKLKKLFGAERAGEEVSKLKKELRRLREEVRALAEGAPSEGDDGDGAQAGA
ncbi:MAG: UDP-3-O-(3-hydroxymyristoyl)glucosamine N-acyltransferase [Planctomycetota bacterium]